MGGLARMCDKGDASSGWQPSFGTDGVIVFNLLLNLIWIVLGGVWMALAWVCAGVLLALTIVGLPWARAAFSIAAYTFLPFGYRVVDRRELTGRDDIGTGPLGFLGNVIWLVLAGWWLAIAHLAVALAFAVTIIGIPFAWAHVKLAALALWPIGKAIVPNDAPIGRMDYGRWNG